METSLRQVGISVENFHDYLYGTRFTVCTDNNPLTYVFTSAKLIAMGHCWLSDLSVYDYDIIYRPDRNNIDADLASRMEPREGETQWQSISQAGSPCLYVSESGSWYVEQPGAPPDLFLLFMLFLHICSLTHWEKCPGKS